MLSHIIASSLLICAILLIRLIFRGRIPNRMIYALWIVVFIRLAVPGFAFHITLSETAARPEVNEKFSDEVLFQPELHRPQYLPNASTEQSENTETSAYQAPSLPSPTQRKGFSITPKQVYLVGAGAVFVWIFVTELAIWRRLKNTRRFFENRNGINVYISDESPSPCIFGIIPSVYVDSSSAESCDLELILMHEFAHIRQFDHIRTLARALILAIHWFNPLVWVYFRAASRDSEFACDEEVTKGLDEHLRLKYAQIIFNYAPRAKNGAVGLGGKPMKKRILAITNNKKVKTVSLVLAIIMSLTVCVLAFTGCIESKAEGTANEGHESSVQESNDSSTDDGAIEWPAELLPEGFPKPEYTEIYSVESKDGEVVIVMFAEDTDRPAHYRLESDLHFKYGYRFFMNTETGEAFIFNRDGVKVTITSSSYHDNHLAEINKISPTGYTYEIRFSTTDLKLDSLFWQYPDANTDLGLEEKVFEEWDESIFPENFPKPIEGLTIMSIEQKSNGVFLTMRGSSVDSQEYLAELVKSGFYDTGVQPFCNENGDYFYEHYYEFNLNPDLPITFCFQICKANDKIIK